MFHHTILGSVCGFRPELNVRDRIRCPEKKKSQLQHGGNSIKEILSWKCLNLFQIPITYSWRHSDWLSSISHHCSSFSSYFFESLQSAKPCFESVHKLCHFLRREVYFVMTRHKLLQACTKDGPQTLIENEYYISHCICKQNVSINKLIFARTNALVHKSMTRG